MRIDVELPVNTENALLALQFAIEGVADSDANSNSDCDCDGDSDCDCDCDVEVTK